jgi:putative SOS response-associated peptidase YedK
VVGPVTISNNSDASAKRIVRLDDLTFNAPILVRFHDDLQFGLVSSNGRAGEERCADESPNTATDEYIAALGWIPSDALIPVDPRYNIPPGTKPMVLHRLEGDPKIDRIFWGYKPTGYKRGPISNARLDTVLANKWPWSWIIKGGARVIVPADGWYEWTGEKGHKEPWYIRAKDEKPVLMAAITPWHPGLEPDAAHGAAIVTDDSAGGMVDIHDRRPVILTREDAQEWIDPETTVERALDLLTTGRPESAFVWYRVTTKMNNSRYELADAIEPI